VISGARDLLGGNGVLLENHIIRHVGDIEVIHTYAGNETMQILIVGRDITGVGACVLDQALGDLPSSVVQRDGEVGYRRDRVCQPEKVPKPVDAVGQLFIGPDRECQV
jgi:hypothetical protein